MSRVRRIAGVSAIIAIINIAPASAQVIANNTPIQSITVTQTGSPGPVVVGGGPKFFSAQATLTDPLSSTRLLGGGGGAFWNVAWSPSIPVGNCGTTANSFGSQTFSVDNAGVFHVSWSPGTPNTLIADGLMTPALGGAGMVTASLACGNGAATGSMSAVWSGERYDGTYSFNGVDGIITITGLTWTSSDPSIATVTNRGTVTGVSAGDVLITATFGSLCWQTVPGTASCAGTTSGSILLHVDPAPTGGGGGGGGGGGAPLTAGPDRVVECASPSGTPVTLQGQLFFTPTTPLTYTWTGPFGVASGLVTTVPLPLGASTSTLTISDGSRTASDGVMITVVDTTAPQISGVSANPAMVWPPNGRMVPASLSVAATDTCDAQLSCQIVSVSGDDGATAADWQVTGPLSLLLRATRSGAGGGRTYTATVECADDSGNKSTKTVDLLVPHDRR
jgi:hypothetical protein